ncbi:hypothetical protein OW763_09215 [Clostridium aestuarii]|uniref:Uncharacterized protein n=1 Tax=Clostridium aestuarii TaxID=338193 RepID=A0ABT4CZV6_9CLOT|nr:hypothetical protein [Clostridium aestuarii]MCY6484518.1 hypothetical protein [Clostridium aestuarii]
MKKIDLKVSKTKKKGLTKRKKSNVEIIGQDCFETQEEDMLIDGEYKLKPDEKIIKVFKFD